MVLRPTRYRPRGMVRGTRPRERHRRAGVFRRVRPGTESRTRALWRRQFRVIVEKFSSTGAQGSRRIGRRGGRDQALVLVRSSRARVSSFTTCWRERSRPRSALSPFPPPPLFGPGARRDRENGVYRSGAQRDSFRVAPMGHHGQRRWYGGADSVVRLHLPYMLNFVYHGPRRLATCGLGKRLRDTFHRRELEVQGASARAARVMTTNPRHAMANPARMSQRGT